MPATTQLDTVAIATLISLFVPLLVGLVTKQSASSTVKVIVNIVAVALTAVLALGITPGLDKMTWALVINTLVLSLAASVTAYKGIWKPTGVTDAIAAKTADIGIGSTPIVLPPVDSEAGQIEATPVPTYSGPVDPYVTDPNYNPANDSVNPETRGESDMPGTPGTVGDPFIGTDVTTPAEVKGL